MFRLKLTVWPNLNRAVCCGACSLAFLAGCTLPQRKPPRDQRLAPVNLVATNSVSFDQLATSDPSHTSSFTESGTATPIANSSSRVTLVSANLPTTVQAASPLQEPSSASQEADATKQAEDNEQAEDTGRVENKKRIENPVQKAGAKPGSEPSISSSHVLEGMTLAEFEMLAMENNPTLKQLGAITQKAAGFKNQVGLRPNPIVGYQAMQLADRGTDQHTAFVEQEFVTGGKLQLNRRVLNEALRAQLFELDAQRFRVMTDLRTKFYEALAAQQQIELTTNFKRVTDRGFEFAELRKKAAEGSQLEVLQSKIQKNEIELALQQAQIRFGSAWRELAALAGTPCLEQLTLSGELPTTVTPIDWSSISATLISQSPEYSAAQARVCEARAKLQRHSMQTIPNLTAQLAAGVDNGTDSQLINLQVGVPLPVFNKNQGNIAAAQAEFCRALQELQRVENSIQSRTATLSNEFDSAAAAVQKYVAEILPSAVQILDLAEQAYQAGESEFLQVLVVRRTFYDAQLQYLRAQTQLAQAQARLDGFLLSGGLNPVMDLSGDTSLRDLTFSQR